MTDSGSNSKAHRGLRERLTAWMQSDRGMAGVFVASLLEMTLVPIPLEIALVPVMLAGHRRRWLAAATAWVGCLVGAALWYWAGYLAFDGIRPLLLELYASEAELERQLQEVRARAFPFVFFAGVTPVPFQVACVVAGSVAQPFGMFILASALARAIRYFGLAGAVTGLNERARDALLNRPWALGAVMTGLGFALLGMGMAIDRWVAPLA